MFRLIPDTKIDFIGKRKFAFVLSAILVAVGLFAATMIWTGHGNLGIDFAGGVMVQGHFEKTVAIGQLREALVQEFPDAQVTQIEDFKMPNAFIIKVKALGPEGQVTGRVAAITALLKNKFPDNNFVTDSEHSIGPAVGKTLRKDTQTAVLISLIGILIYIAIRFDFRSGVAATVATFHDVLAVLGITYFLGLEFDSLIVTALLTLAGYSLTDTVVVYDRIRENLRKYRGRGEFVATINKSINEVLSRTVNTSMTVLIVLVILFLFAGEVVHNFSLSLILGVIIGTYSSVFVASPIVVEWEARRPKRFK